MDRSGNTKTEREAKGKIKLTHYLKTRKLGFKYLDKNLRKKGGREIMGRNKNTLGNSFIEKVKSVFLQNIFKPDHQKNKNKA